MQLVPLVCGCTTLHMNLHRNVRGRPDSACVGVAFDDHCFLFVLKLFKLGYTNVAAQQNATWLCRHCSMS